LRSFELKQLFSLHGSIHTKCGTQPASCLMGTGVLSHVKWLMDETDNLPPFIAEVKNAGAIILFSHILS